VERSQKWSVGTEVNPAVPHPRVLRWDFSSQAALREQRGERQMGSVGHQQLVVPHCRVQSRFPWLSQTLGQETAFFQEHPMLRSICTGHCKARQD